MAYSFPEYALDVLNTLEENGKEAYFVGGCVRDMLLSKEPNDYDITTNALPGEIKEIFSSFQTVDTGIKHGTVTIISDGQPVEVTTYRIDGEYDDARHPREVTFVSDLSEDLSRRDFTVNAMAYNPKSGLTDLFGGAEDLEKKIIRTVGESERRFSEDALRIVRAFRFASVLDFEIDGETALRCEKLIHTLGAVSVERIFSEVKKLFTGPGAGRILKSYPHCLEKCFSSVSKKALEKAGGFIDLLPPSFPVRMAAVCDSPDIAKKEMKHLRASNAESAGTVSICREKTTPLPKERNALLRLMGRMDDDNIVMYAALRKVLFDDDGDGFLCRYEETKSSHPVYKVSHLDISGNDVIGRTGAKGEEIGKILSSLLDLVIDGKIKNEKDALLKEAEKIFKEKENGR